MREEPVIFGAAVEGLQRAFGRELSAELKTRARQLGIDFDRPQVAYPVATYIALLRVLAEALCGDVPDGERYAFLGRRFMKGFVQTGVGFAALTAGKLLGPRRTLLRMGRNFRTASNYLETEFTEVGPKELLIRTFVNEPYRSQLTERTTLMLDYRRGILEETLTLVGARGTVTVARSNPEQHDITFRAVWD